MLGACNKTPNTRDDAHVFKNNNGLNIPWHFDLYHSSADFYAGLAPLRSLIVAPNGTETIYASDFQLNKQYYVTQYSDDYKYGIWSESSLWDHDSGIVKFPSTQFGPSTVAQTFPNAARYVLLDKTRTSTVWKAVSKDNQPVPAGEHYEITFRRDHTYTFHENGKISQDIFRAKDMESLMTPVNNSNRSFFAALIGMDGYLYQGPEDSGLQDPPRYLSDSMVFLYYTPFPDRTRLMMVRQ